jgi:hypothetical protein
MIEVFGNLLSLEAIDFTDVIIAFAINTDDYYGTEISILFSTVSKVYGGENIETFVSEKLLIVLTMEIFLIIVLKLLSLNCS